MICFGEIARQIVGKPVQQVLKSARAFGDIPPDIAAIVSMRFTFSVVLTQQSFYKQDKTYQITSIIASHGRQRALPHVPNAPRARQARTGIEAGSSGHTPSLDSHGGESVRTLFRASDNYPIDDYT
jgi:hypothetical protein